MDVDQQQNNTVQYGSPDARQGNTYGEVTLQSNSEQVKQMIYVNQNDDDDLVWCDSCLDDFNDVEAGDDLVMCDKCNVAVHQSCYGHGLLKEFPKGDWFCERCKALMAQESNQGGYCEPKAFACGLCSDLRGAIVKTNIGWVHLTCVNWIPDVWFHEDAEKTRVEGQINAGRRQLSCVYCKGKHKKKVGCCIQCDYKDCMASFHVRCAIKQELIKPWDEMDDHMDKDQDWNAYIFCKKHITTATTALQKFGLNGIKG